MTKSTPTDHPIHALLSGRWSPRAFAATPVPTAALQRLFEAARWAASCFNAQPWAFVYATQDEPERFERIAGLLAGPNQAWAPKAPVLMIAVARLSFAHNGKPNGHALYDLGQAVANLSTQATAEGLFVHQMAGFDAQGAVAALGLPEGWQAVTAIALGYVGEADQLPEALAERERGPRVRKAQASFVFNGSFDVEASGG